MFSRPKRAYLDAASGRTANPSSPHVEGRRARALLEEARTRIARLTEVQPDDVIFTSGATESNALAILGSVRALRAAGKEPQLFYLPSAHASIVENVKLLEEEGVRTEALPVRDYRIDTDALRKKLQGKTIVITMEAVCGETGVVWNTREVADVLRRSGAETQLLHVDASQAPFTEKLTRDHFGAQLLTFDAAKVSTVRGSGVLIAHRTITLAPLYRGGGQERELRPGSEAPELALTFANALEATSAQREVFTKEAHTARTKLIARLTQALPQIYVQEGKAQAPQILNLSLVGRDTDYLVALLDEAGFAVATRSACETDSEDGSRAVFVLTGEREKARSTLRISWGSGISMRVLDQFATALINAVKFLDSNMLR